MIVNAVRLNHAVLYVADLTRSVSFYEAAFGMTVAAREARANAAFIGESSHGATKSVYGHDPDGNEFEVMWMLPRAEWGRYVNAAPIDRLDLSAEVARWTGVRTAAELMPVEPR
ncbi:MAG: hypothetical protein JWM76_4711 [Pseudonocardiales bacterium]|nr:hypothetical protein [Pseudonocardiales bacterium]